jgi:hypothetical protein
MSIPAKPLTEITSQALHVLTQEIGTADTLRFLSQFSTGSGNYTKEREAYFGHLSLDDLLAEIKTTDSDDK